MTIEIDDYIQLYYSNGYYYAYIRDWGVIPIGVLSSTQLLYEYPRSNAKSSAARVYQKSPERKPQDTPLVCTAAAACTSIHHYDVRAFTAVPVGIQVPPGCAYSAVVQDT